MASCSRQAWTAAAARASAALILSTLWLAPVRASDGEPVTVSGTVLVSDRDRAALDKSGVVVWLTPLDAPAPPTPQRLKIVQHGKKFEPRVLVAPVRSSVEFPNLDPFLHNVFSLFDGKRFDLGLYEAGTSRSVTLSREGVCYVFCNIHPEMSAVIVVVGSTLFAQTDRGGMFSIPGVPPGRYTVTVWHDRFKPEATGNVSRDIVVSASASTVPPIRLAETTRIAPPHRNKFGHDYTPPPSILYP
ncbi:MAG: carboxypeptidase regulatory-like domain-containing protein [Vicinamibacterales bacterium]